MAKPLKVKERSTSVDAMQFTGKNGADISNWINTSRLAKQGKIRARNGGVYVKISIKNQPPFTIKKTDIAICRNGVFYFYNTVGFDREFIFPKGFVK